MQIWRTTRSEALDKLEATHREIRVNHTGRPYNAEHMNHAFALALAAQFQGFCRDLHSECSDHLMQSLRHLNVRQDVVDVLSERMVAGRKLDNKNANPSSIGSDFGFFGFKFIQEVKDHNQRNEGRLKKLEQLNTWRNAIAHADFADERVAGYLTIAKVRQWRNACNHLASQFDSVMRIKLNSLTGNEPWS